MPSADFCPAVSRPCGRLSRLRGTKQISRGKLTYLTEEIQAEGFIRRLPPFVVGDRFTVEVKAKARTSDRDAHGLKAFREEGAVRQYYLVSQDRIDRRSEGIEYLHWETFLSRLWQ